VRWDTDVKTGGRVVASMTTSMGLSETGTITVGTEIYAIDRPNGKTGGVWRVCDPAGAELCVVRKPKALRRAVTITMDGVTWDLGTRSHIRSKMVLSKAFDGGDAKAVGCIEPAKTLSSSAKCRIDADTLPTLGGFTMIWVYFMLERRAYIGAGSGAGV
jgi:hypothetical protein